MILIEVDILRTSMALSLGWTANYQIKTNHTKVSGYIYKFSYLLPSHNLKKNCLKLFSLTGFVYLKTKARSWLKIDK